MGGFRGRVLLGYVIAALAVVVALVFAEAPIGLAGIVAVAFVVSGVTLYTATARVSESARLVVGAAREIAQGDVPIRLETGSEDELGSVIAEFNRMASSLEIRVAEASQERNRLMAVINSSVDAIVAVDGANNVTFANAAVAAMLDRDPANVVGHPFAFLMSHPEVIMGLRESRDAGLRSSHVVELPSRKVLRAIITPIVGGGAWSSLVVFHDLTDQKRVEQVRRDFVANVSHELRTPLAAVKSVIETLDAGAVDDPAVAREFLGRADGEVDRLVQMVEELLELSRIESGELPLSHDPVDMAGAIASAVDRLRPQAERLGLSLAMEIGAGVPPVAGDRVSLERAVVNLVQNAIKFTPEGGAITVRLEPDDGGAAVSVRDNGVGIEPEDIPRVFERFFKADRARRAGGTGIGLALVKHTVEAYGGRVKVESELGTGSTFRFWLPALPSADSSSPVSPDGAKTRP